MSDRTIPADGIGMHLYTMRGPLAEDYPRHPEAAGGDRLPDSRGEWPVRSLRGRDPVLRR